MILSATHRALYQPFLVLLWSDLVEDQIAIRAPLPAEYPDVARLTREVFIGEGFAGPEFAARLNAVADRAQRNEALVAVSPKGVLGTVCYLGAGSPGRQMARDDEAEIRLLAVANSERNRGVGARLVAVCLSRARRESVSRVVLCTQPSMEAAQRLYARAGFRRTPDRDWRTKANRDMLAFAIDLDT